MAPLILGDEERQEPQGIANSRSMPHLLVMRAKIVLACAAGDTNKDITERLGLSGTTVGKWRKRYLVGGLAGLHDKLRPGRPRT
jgi:transposase